VYASGVVKSENQYTVFSTVSGVLQSVKVKCRTIYYFWATLAFDLKGEKAAFEYGKRTMNVSIEPRKQSVYSKISWPKWKPKYKQLKINWLLIQSVYNRNKNIKQYNVISEVEYERVELAYKNSKSNYEAALKQLAQLKTQFRTEQNRNQINLKITEKTQGDYVVKSAFSGELFDVLVKEGALITPQTPLAILGKKNAYVLELDVDENDMVQVHVGQNRKRNDGANKGSVQATAILMS